MKNIKNFTLLILIICSTKVFCQININGIQILLDDTIIISSLENVELRIKVINSRDNNLCLPGIKNHCNTNTFATIGYMYNIKNPKEYCFPRPISLNMFILDENMKYIIPDYDDTFNGFDYTNEGRSIVSIWVDSMNFNFLKGRLGIIAHTIKKLYESSLTINARDSLEIEIECNLWGFNLKPGKYYAFLIYYSDDCKQLEASIEGHEPLYNCDEMKTIFGDNYFQGLVKSNTAVLIYEEDQ